MSATEHLAPTPTRRFERLAAWAAGVHLGRILAFSLAAAAVVAVSGTFAAIRGFPPFGSDPGSVLLWLYADLIVLLLLAVVIAWRVVALWVERRRGSAGSRLHVRMVRLFGFVSVVPAIIVALASVVFFNFGLQSWLSTQVRTVLEESVAVAEAYLHEHKQNIRADVLAMAQDLSRDVVALENNPGLFNRVVDFQTRVRELSEAVVFDGSGAVRARSGFSYMLEIDPIPPNFLEQARNGEVAILTGADDDRVRALVRLDGFLDMYLFVGRIVDPKVVAHTTRTRGAVERFERLEFQRTGMQVSFALVFVGIALVLLLAASWVGLLMASQLSRPLSALIAATERVRAGDLTARVPERGAPDEIGSLSRAFNRMTNDLEQNRRELLEANRQLDQRRRFTEAVLEGVSAGVVGLDEEGRINLPNASASELLGLTADRMIGQRLGDAVPEMETLLQDARRLRSGRPVVSEVRLQRAKETRTLLTRVSVERDGEEIIGFVVTFDDVYRAGRAQRKAAWADVARRIAHEIKNPLTPIQLSAERLKRKYLSEIVSDPETFITCTDTIVRQVGDIGRMVDEFSRLRPHAGAGYPAGEPDRDVPPGRIPAAQTRIATLPSPRNCPTARSLPVRRAPDRPGPDQPAVERGGGDRGPGRRHPGRAAGRRALALWQRHDGDRSRGQWQGIAGAEARDRLTEPYVTTRIKGTGLGLAIVKKIMEDHGGRLRLEDGPNGGACVILELPGEPVSDDEVQAELDAQMDGVAVVPGR